MDTVRQFWPIEAIIDDHWGSLKIIDDHRLSLTIIDDHRRSLTEWERGSVAISDGRWWHVVVDRDRRRLWMDVRYRRQKAGVLMRRWNSETLRWLSPLMLLWRVVAAAGRSDRPLGDWSRLGLLRHRRGWRLALLRSWSGRLALRLRLRLRLVLLRLRFILLRLRFVLLRFRFVLLRFRLILLLRLVLVLRLVLDLWLRLCLALVAALLVLVVGRLLGDRGLALRHVPLVLLPLVPLLVLERHLLVLRLHLRRLLSPPSAQPLGHLAHARVGLAHADAGAVVVGVPHERVHASLRRVWVLLRSHTLPLTRVRGHLVLVLLFRESRFVL